MDITLKLGRYLFKNRLYFRKYLWKHVGKGFFYFRRGNRKAYGHTRYEILTVGSKLNLLAVAVNTAGSKPDFFGSLLTDKVFITDTDTGSVDVPKTPAGGRCEIKTGTGDIKMEIK